VPDALAHCVQLQAKLNCCGGHALLTLCRPSRYLSTVHAESGREGGWHAALAVIASQAAPALAA
jgi:hypothetical protein